MKVCFNRVRRICTEKCHRDYEMYGIHAKYNCPPGLGYQEEEIPDDIPNIIEYILKMEMKK